MASIRISFILCRAHSTELAASQYNNYIVDGDKPLDLRVYGLLSDTAENVFFSYDPATTKFEKDEIVHVASSRKMVIHDMMRCMLFPPMSGILITYLCASVRKDIQRPDARIQ